MITREEFSRLSIGSKVKVTGSIWVSDGIYVVCGLDPYLPADECWSSLRVDRYGDGNGLWVETKCLSIPNKIYLGGE